MTVQALIFDFDGLILDTEAPAYESWCRIYSEYGKELELERWQADIGTVFAFDPVAHLETLVGRPLDHAALWEQRQALKESLCVGLPVLPGVHELLEAASDAGLPLGLASSSGRQWVMHWLEQHNLVRYFACIRTRDDVAQPKPAPDLYLSAAACLGVPPAHCVALEDSPNGLRAALAAGMRCVVIPTALTAMLSYEGAVLRLQSLADITLPELLDRLTR